MYTGGIGSGQSDDKARAFKGMAAFEPGGKGGMDDLVAGRQCGDCKICCIVPPIDEPEMQKQTNAACRHRSHTGCDIYETRPSACRTYFCGWRRLAFLDDDWRPDRSGVLIESGTGATTGAGSLVLVLVANPLKTVRDPRFQDFIGTGMAQKLSMFLCLPGSRGQAKAALALNTPHLAAARSRSQVRLALEDVLRRLGAHDFVPYVIGHSGNDVST